MKRNAQLESDICKKSTCDLTGLKTGITEVPHHTSVVNWTQLTSKFQFAPHGFRRDTPPCRTCLIVLTNYSDQNRKLTDSCMKQRVDCNDPDRCESMKKQNAAERVKADT